MKRNGVKVILNTKADPRMILKHEPHAVVISTGSVTQFPDIPGLDNPNVLTVKQVMLDQAAVGPNVVVLGGGNTGCEVAEYLSQKGHKVSILEMGGKVAADIGPARRYLLTRRLRENRVRSMILCRIKSVHKNSVLYIRQSKDGHRSLRELDGVDTFINSLGMRAKDHLRDELLGKVERVHLIGDALHPGKILDAVAEGAAVARMIENGEFPRSDKD